MSLDLEALTTRPSAVAAAIEGLLAALGIRKDEHTTGTPERVARYWTEALAGYHTDPAVHLARTFPAHPDAGMVVQTGIKVRSVCAHHLLPITGTATVAYRPRPGAPVVGLSKLARLVDGYARRLQVQERLGAQVAAAIQERLAPVGAGCVVTATHGCMTHRGVLQPDASTTTQSLTGDWAPGHPDVVAVLAEHHRTT